MIYAKNVSDKVVKVAISKWSSEEADDDYIEIGPGEVVQWARSDERGFLMSVIWGDNKPVLYSMRLDGYIIIYSSSVENNGRGISPLYSLPSV
ncbi:hypothetical protein Ppb6_00726 [Photorhabdus australis subsp. thailandensis]|uniref:Uncharacterized protein n=1 Tax=Photorhabdus australis subsp. thailandensis TaxID=2805096 RepID=A0A1C0U7V8_9GAMM|nr:hypothetical protein [Photorhabdus australis]OCQ54001.1 hypothetical protein Ppb6_00726 [Photorhabdus australis subsp. thailandensis]